MKIVLGTHNEKKRAELAALLSPFHIDVVSLGDLEDTIDVVEDGDSFAANAAKKASQQATHLGMWTVGEDSGLCVDALDGAPGIYSARYAGPNATDEQNNQKLLDALADVPDDKRGAHYVCHLCLADPKGVAVFDCGGICRGRIRRQPAGSGGFGYDPLFEILELHRTFGQMGGAAKSVLSHRARAMRRFVPKLLVALRDK